MAKRTTITIPDDLLPVYDQYGHLFSVTEVAVAAIRAKLADLQSSEEARIAAAYLAGFKAGKESKGK